MSTLSVVILNWNTRDLLRQTIASIIDDALEHRYEVIVVDNASSDDSVAMVEKEFPLVKVIANPANVGYAAGNNIGMKKAQGEYILLLNSDIVAPRGLLPAMLRHMENHPEAGACGPALLLPNGKFQTGGAGYSVSAVTGFNYFFFLSILFPRTFRGMFLHQQKFDGMQGHVDVDWLAGACLMVRRTVVEKAGPLDEGFFMYAEDAEWCDRIKNHGWGIHYLPFLKVIHYHGASSKKVSKVNTRWLTALYGYIKIKNGPLDHFFFRLFSFLGFVLRGAIYGAMALLGKKDASTRCREMMVYMKTALLGGSP